MTHSEMIDSLITKLCNAEYRNNLGVGSGTSSVLYSRRSEETIAARGAIAEWLQDNINNNYLEKQVLEQRVRFLEEMVSKSNFKPFVQEEDSNEKT